MLGDDLEEWTAESSMLKRTFRQLRLVAGLIERRQPGQEKTGPAGHLQCRLYLRRPQEYEPDHVARLKAAPGWRRRTA
jgi:ATP-dependent Lhr-like helicase